MKRKKSEDVQVYTIGILLQRTPHFFPWLLAAIGNGGTTGLHRTPQNNNVFFKKSV